MNNTEDKPSRRRKITILAVLFLILVVLPAGSWYYLRGGLNWHRQAVAELRHYAQIRPVYVILPNGERFDDLDGKVCVMYNFGSNAALTDDNKRILDTYQSLFEQFGQHTDQTVRQSFRLVPIFESPNAEFRSYFQKLPAADYATWRYSGGIASWNAILDNSYAQFCRDEGVKPSAQYFAVSDTSGAIRRFYNALDDNQVGRMVEHIALLLPKEQ